MPYARRVPHVTEKGYISKIVFYRPNNDQKSVYRRLNLCCVPKPFVITEQTHVNGKFDTTSQRNYTCI
jgi:hypothetical protein